MKNKRMHIDVSRLFIYYNGRLIGNNYQEYGLADQGTFIHTAIEGLKRFGCCKEASFPYHKAYVSQKPPPQCYDEAVHYRIADSMSVDCNLNEMKACLAEGYPFAFGLQLFQSSAYAERNGGVMHDPTPYDSQAPVHGWHAMLAVGYSDTSQCFIVRNSWGDQWVCFSFLFTVRLALFLSREIKGIVISPIIICVIETIVKIYMPSKQ